jgi:hypothetical protein
VAQPGSAPALGAGGRRFESARPDLAKFPFLCGKRLLGLRFALVADLGGNGICACLCLCRPAMSASRRAFAASCPVSEVGVDAHREPGVDVPDLRLRVGGIDAGFRHERGIGVPERVERHPFGIGARPSSSSIRFARSIAGRRILLRIALRSRFVPFSVGKTKSPGREKGEPALWQVSSSRRGERDRSPAHRPLSWTPPREACPRRDQRHASAGPRPRTPADRPP